MPLLAQSSGAPAVLPSAALKQYIPPVRQYSKGTIARTTPTVGGSEHTVFLIVYGSEGRLANAPVLVARILGSLVFLRFLEVVLLLPTTVHTLHRVSRAGAGVDKSTIQAQ